MATAVLDLYLKDFLAIISVAIVSLTVVDSTVDTRQAFERYFQLKLRTLQIVINLITFNPDTTLSNCSAQTLTVGFGFMPTS